jgi:DNA mismatch repair protein MutH
MVEEESVGAMVLWETETREEAKVKKSRTELADSDRYPRSGVMLHWVPDE